MAATTWNPDDKAGNLALSGGDLTATVSLNDFMCVRSIYSTSSSDGFYWEIPFNQINAGVEPVSMIGVGTSAVNLNLQLGGTALGWAFQDDALTYHNGVVISPTSAGFANGSVVMVALKIPNLWWGVDGTWLGGGNPSAGTGAQYTDLAGTIYAMACMRRGTGGDPTVIQTANFGASAFTYTVPTGFIKGFGTGLPIQIGTRRSHPIIWI